MLVHADVLVLQGGRSALHHSRFTCIGAEFYFLGPPTHVWGSVTGSVHFRYSHSDRIVMSTNSITSKVSCLRFSQSSQKTGAKFGRDALGIQVEMSVPPTG